MKLLVIPFVILAFTCCNSSTIELNPEDRMTELLKSKGYETKFVKINIIQISDRPEEINRMESKYEVVDFSKEEIFTENINNLIDIQYWSENEIKFRFIDDSGNTSIHKIILND